MTDTYADAKARFLADIASHELRILRDDGLYRHIRLTRPNTICYRFDLITWPGHLAYTGDMGTYVFQRADDMFAFFRAAADSRYPLPINPGYWSEKLLAVDGGRRANGVREYQAARFLARTKTQLVDWWQDSDLTTTGRRELREAFQEQLFDHADEVSEEGAYNLLVEFDAGIEGQTFRFEDIGEFDFTDHTVHYLWACCALVWGIQQYDARQAPAPAGTRCPGSLREGTGCGICDACDGERAAMK